METLRAKLDIGSESELTLDATLDESLVPMTHDAMKRYAGKIRMLSRIHSEIAKKLNDPRELERKAFLIRYVPESDNPNELAELILGSMFRANQA